MKIPGYTIERQSGQGGMAVVYRALQESLGRPVALKVMNPLFANIPEFSERFLNEGCLLAALQHSHIITIYDIGVSADYHYISMEYVDGGDLQQRIRHGIPPQTALDYVITLGSCLAAAHAAHIVHRDIKPANILFRRDGTLLLTDFGIAKQLENPKELTATGSMIGSPYYLSPEQAMGRPIDGRADIYSLGIVLYEMLVEKKPFEGDSQVEIAMQHIDGTLPRLPQELSHFQSLCDRMTAKKPEDRFRDAASMLRAAQHLRDTGRWDDAGPGETTLILDAQQPPTPISASTTLPPRNPHTGTRWVAQPHRVVTGKMGKLAVGVSSLTLVVGLVVSGRVGFKDTGRPAPVVSKPLVQAHTTIHPATPIHPDTPVPADIPVQMVSPPLIDSPPQGVSQAAVSTQPQADHQAQVDGLLRAAHTALSDYRLTTPEHDNAYDYYKQVLAIDPGNRQATTGFTLIADRYLTLAQQAFAKGKHTQASHYVTEGLQIKSDHAELLALHDRLEHQDRHHRAGDEPNAVRHLGKSVDRFFRNVREMFD
jgi:serine/threonine-protein kinase PpkA